MIRTRTKIDNQEKEFKVGDKVEWGYPWSDESLIEYGIITGIWIGKYSGDEYMDIKTGDKSDTVAKRVSGQWIVYRGYHDYEIPLRYRKKRNI